MYGRRRRSSLHRNSVETLISEGRYSISYTASARSSERRSIGSLHLIDTHCHRSQHSLKQGVTVIELVNMCTTGQPWTSAVTACLTRLHITTRTLEAELQRGCKDSSNSGICRCSMVPTCQYHLFHPAFKRARDGNRIHEAAIMWLSHFFMKGQSEPPSKHARFCHD